MAKAVPNLCVSRKVFLKHHASQLEYSLWCNTESAICNIRLAVNPVEVLNNICPCWLDVMYQPRLSVCVTRINIGLMICAGMVLA